jgi:uroporphyrin-III C-methyltransferase
VLTATTADEQLADALLEAARTPRITTVILMGMSRLSEITTLFSSYGGAEVPAAVIQNGTLPTARLVVGTVADIAARAAHAGLGAPAIIVLGEVVRLAKTPAQAGATANELPTLLRELLPYSKVA